MLVNLGGGEHDAVTNWLLANRKIDQVLVLDPFARSKEHNVAAQQKVVDNGGADVVTSISVLNVVPEVKNRIRHIVLVEHILKKGGFAYFKVWPGMWPERGSGKSALNEKSGLWQANAWAVEFVPEVAAVFGQDNVRCDANLNLIVAFKP